MIEEDELFIEENLTQFREEPNSFFRQISSSSSLELEQVQQLNAEIFQEEEIDEFVKNGNSTKINEDRSNQFFQNRKVSVEEIFIEQSQQDNLDICNLENSSILDFSDNTQISNDDNYQQKNVSQNSYDNDSKKSSLQYNHIQELIKSLKNRFNQDNFNKANIKKITEIIDSQNQELQQINQQELNDFINQSIKFFKDGKMKSKFEFQTENKFLQKMIIIINQLIPDLYIKEQQIEENTLEYYLDQQKKIIQNNKIVFFKENQFLKYNNDNFKKYLEKGNYLISYDGSNIYKISQTEKINIDNIEQQKKLLQDQKRILITNVQLRIQKEGKKIIQIFFNGEWIKIHNDAKVFYYDDKMLQIYDVWSKIKNEFKKEQFGNNFKIASFVIFGYQLADYQNRSSKKTNATQDAIQIIRNDSDSILRQLFEDIHQIYIEEQQIKDKNKKVYAKRYSMKKFIECFNKQMNKQKIRNKKIKKKSQVNIKEINGFEVTKQRIQNYCKEIEVKLLTLISDSSITFITFSKILDLYLQIFQITSLEQALKKSFSKTNNIQKNKKISKRKN